MLTPERILQVADRVSVLGIDLACRSWADIGSALIAFDQQRFTKAVPDAITWEPVVKPA